MPHMIVRRPLGGAIVLIYLLVGYVIPATVRGLMGFESRIYRDPVLDVTQLLYGTVFIAAVAGVAIWNSGRRPMPMMNIRPPNFAIYAGALATMVLLAMVGYVSGLSGWRYAGAGMADNLNPISVYYVIAPQVFGFLGFLEIFCFDNSRRSIIEHRIICLLLCAGLISVASGIGPMLEAMLFILFSVFPSQVRFLIFRESGLSENQRAFMRAGLMPMIITAMVLLAAGLILGEQIKTGADRDTARLFYSSMSAGEYIFYLIERFSVTWVSLNVALSEFSTTSWSDVSQNLLAPITTLLYRIDVLLGGGLDIAKPFAGSLMRINYLLINAYPVNEREGSSPGLIAGFIIAFPLPFSILICCLYVNLAKKIINSLSTGMRGVPTWFGLIILTYYFVSIFASPLDYLLILDNGPIFFLLFAATAYFWSKRVAAERRYA